MPDADSVELPSVVDTNTDLSTVHALPADTGETEGDTTSDSCTLREGDTDWNPQWDTAFGTETMARHIRISAIDMYQNTRIPIMREGVAVSNPWISLVEGKKALLRVSVTLEADRSH